MVHNRWFQLQYNLASFIVEREQLGINRVRNVALEPPLARRVSPDLSLKQIKRILKPQSAPKTRKAIKRDCQMHSDQDENEKKLPDIWSLVTSLGYC